VRPATITLVSLLVLTTALLSACDDENRNIILATTTSTENSGLLDVLLPVFEAETGHNVRVIAVGSGAALRLGEQGDADVILAHAPAAEQAFVEAGYGIERMRVMYNDFIIVGPPDDPADIGGLNDAAEALRRIADAGARFASRGDDSGTHQMELELWAAAGVSGPSGSAWYTETGQGMGETLTIAAERGEYTLTDRGTWLEVANPASLPLLVEGDERLFNVYHVMVVNPALHDHEINVAGARALSAFLVDAETQRMIGEYGVEQYGQPLFVPDAE
jgi:tungstate transport system substrate-binding protein